MMFYYVLPTLWTIVGVIIYTVIPRVHPQKKMRWKEDINLWAIMGATTFLGIQIFVAIISDSFGHTPYDLSLRGIGLNVLYIVPAIVAREGIRAYSVGVFCKNTNKNTMFIIIVLIMAVTQINTVGIATITNMETLTQFVVKNVAPVLCQNILLTYLALYGGAMPAIIYLGIINGFEWLSPILPTLDWFPSGIINIVVPMLMVCVFQYLYGKLTKDVKPRDEKVGGILGWILTLGISVLLIWFVVGVFPVYPSVVATGSMEPMIYPGDVVLVEKLQDMEDVYELKVGDVIHFSRDNIRITHRIVEVIEDQIGNRSYRTKGDNNSAEDTRLVLPQEVIGTVERVIPKIGLPTLWIKSIPHDELDQIVF